MLLRKEERDFLLRQKVRNEKNLSISYVVFKRDTTILRIFTASLLLLENEIIMIYNGTEFLL